MLWKMEAEAGIQEHLLCKLEEPLGAQRGGFRKAQLPGKLASGEQWV